MKANSNDRLASYHPRRGLSIPLLTILDSSGNILEDQQRAMTRFAIQEGRGADIIFAVGTNGEWNRMDNPHRQQAARIIVDECRRAAKVHPVEAWVGITALSRAETLENLRYSIELEADAAVVAPLSIPDVDDTLKLVTRDIANVFEHAGRTIPVFLYDNPGISAPGKRPHLFTAEIEKMSKLAFVRGAKVTASREDLAVFTRAAGQFKSLHPDFPIYAGNPNLIFDLFMPPAGIAATARDYWKRYLQHDALPSGVVAGYSNALPREWQRGWQVCVEHDVEQMVRYAQPLAEFQQACTFTRAGHEYCPVMACLKVACVEHGVIASDAIATGTLALSPEERGEFVRRFRELRAKIEHRLEPEWISRSEVESHRHPASHG